MLFFCFAIFCFTLFLFSCSVRTVGYICSMPIRSASKAGQSERAKRDAAVSNGKLGMERTGRAGAGGEGKWGRV